MNKLFNYLNSLHPVLSILILLVFICFGLFALIKCADIFVKGSSLLAYKLKIPPLIIGLTIVSMGTSLPEASVSITSSINGLNDLSVSNVVGSNIFNLLIVLGLSILVCIKGLKLNRNILLRDIPFMIIASLLLIIFSLNYTISVIEGIILLIIFLIYLTLTIIQGKNEKTTQEAVNTKHNFLITILMVIVGIVGVIIFGDFVTKSSREIALIIGISDTLIGLTIVAIGTSLPELITSIVASKNNENDIAIGNVVGSNIFNILFILSASSIISPLTISNNSLIDMIIMTSIFIVFYISLLIFKKLSKKTGFIMIVIYIIYLIYTILRETL